MFDVMGRDSNKYVGWSQGKGWGIGNGRSITTDLTLTSEVVFGGVKRFIALGKVMINKWTSVCKSEIVNLLNLFHSSLDMTPVLK